MKTALAALACTACVSASAQKQYPEQEKMKPGMSEYWTPQPKVVTPGDIKTNSAPSDAIVLFDGKDLSAWQNAKGGPAEWIVKDGVFTVDKKKGDILTKQKFENFQLHIEWCVPENITGTSQGRGNSGIFLQDMYEIQVLDCYNNETYVNGQTGSVYKQTPPLANAMRKPGEWNVYDIIYSAPIFKEDGTYRVPPRGVKIPVTSMYLGFIRRIRSFMMILTQSSWKAPWLRKLNRYNFKLLLSTIFTSGI